MRYLKPAATRKYKNGVILLSLSLWLMGCATLNTPPPTPKVERYYPAQSLLQKHPVVLWPVSMTNWALLELAKEYRKQALACNADKDSIWAETYGAAPATEAQPAAESKPWWRFWQ